MPRQVFENQLTLKWIDTLADSTLATVTQAEWDGGTNLTPQITADGFGLNWNNNVASIDMIAEGKISQKPGTRGASVTLTAVRDDTSDDVWTTFDYGTSGFLVAAPFGEPATGDELYVFDCAAQEPQPQQSAANTYQQAQVELPCDDWNLKSELVA